MNRNEAWVYYKKWMKEDTYSPALKSKVYITRKGWDHLVRGTKGNRRSKSDAHNKLSLLKLAKKIISTSTTFTLEKKEGVQYILLQESLMYKNKRTVVKVIIKFGINQKKFFYSVMRK